MMVFTSNFSGTSPARAREAARLLCDENFWDCWPLHDMEHDLGIHWGQEGTKKQLILALCLYADILADPDWPS